MDNILAFKHSGDMGDIVSSLPTVKAICEKENAKAHYILDASGGYLDDYVKEMCPNGNKFSLEQAQFLAPLLKAQPYIADVEIDTFGNKECWCNLNKFRREFRNRETVKRTNQNLMFLHQAAFNLPIGYTGDWLDIKVDKEPEGVVCIRSNRYHSDHLVWELFIHKMEMEQTPYSFVGTDLEYNAFKDAFREAKPKRVIVKDALELAKVIGESKEIVCNGTLGFWLAVGMDHPQIFHEICGGVPTTYFPSGLDKKTPNIRYFQGGHFVK